VTKPPSSSVTVIASGSKNHEWWSAWVISSLICELAKWSACSFMEASWTLGDPGQREPSEEGKTRGRDQAIP
jgi:hypothetical protein